jgi:hypothetical protein
MEKDRGGDSSKSFETSPGVWPVERFDPAASGSRYSCHSALGGLLF